MVYVEKKVIIKSKNLIKAANNRIVIMKRNRIIFDAVAMVNKDTKEICWYDFKSKQFYKECLPSDYIEVEYINK